MPTDPPPDPPADVPPPLSPEAEADAEITEADKDRFARRWRELAPDDLAGLADADVEEPG